MAVARASAHRFSKPCVDAIHLLDGLGVEGDAHCGATVKHRSRLARGAHTPNLRQVHLLHAELLDALADAGFAVAPGDLGENVTTRGAELLALPTDSLVHLGPSAVVRITGLRNPCMQIEAFRPGLLAQVLRRLPGGDMQRLMGVMGVVAAGGDVQAGDTIELELPPPPHRALAAV